MLNGKRIARSALSISAIFFFCAMSAPTAAQIYPMPPDVRLDDENDVELMSGLPSADIPGISIGDKQNGISLTLSFDNELMWRTSLEAGIEIRGDYTVFDLGKNGEKILGYNGQAPGGFSTYSGGQYVCNGAAGTFTDRSGAIYDLALSNCSQGKVTHVKLANGLERTYYYNSAPLTTYSAGALTVVQSNGYVFKTLVDSPTKLRFVLFNANVDSCAPTATACSFTHNWPSITLEVKPGTVGLSDIYVTRGASELTILKGDNYDGIGQLPYGRLVQIFRPGAGATPTVSYQLCRRATPFNCFYYVNPGGGIGGGTLTGIKDKVTHSTRNGVTWSYNYITNIGPVYYRYSSARPDGQTRAMLAYTYAHQSWPMYVDLPGKRVTFSNTEAARIVGVTHGLGDAEQDSYDARGNVLEKRKVATTGTGLPDLVTTVVYPTSCANMKTCNRPTSVTDPKGNVTFYTYTADGLLETETSPTDANGIAAVIRHSYVQRSPMVSNGSGGFTAGPSIWLLAEDRTCRASATVGNACAAGAADEVVTSYDYGPVTGANNLLLRSTTITADGTSRKTCIIYDVQGNAIGTTAPRGATLGGCQ